MLEAQDLEMIKQMIVSTLSAVAEKPKKPRKPYKKRKKVDKSPKSAIIQEPAPVPLNQPRIRKMGRAIGTTEEVRGSGHGKQCRTESFQPINNRPNTFLQTAEASMFKNDSALDKKLSGKNIPVPRRSTAELWEVDCQVCHRPTIVSPSMVMIDPDDGSAKYTCDSCVRR